MDAILAVIAAATRDGASDADLRRGAVACRALADALDAASPSPRPSGVVSASTVPAPRPRADVVAPGAPGGASSSLPSGVRAVSLDAATGTPPDTPVTSTDTTRPERPPINAAVSANPFAGLSANHVLELAISKLRAHVVASGAPGGASTSLPSAVRALSLGTATGTPPGASVTSTDATRPDRPPVSDGPDRPPVMPAVSANPFAGLSADQVLDLAISKLRDAVGEPATAPPTSLGQPFHLTLVPIPRVS
ncbi:MAG: hypothetical protein IPL61_09355 [Myxococcales bacterium]|nr:hypothetical protein [Myxococcales bacterium]